MMKGRNLRGTTLIPAINHMQALSCVTCILRRGLHLMDSSARLMREIRVLQGTERNLQPVIPSLCQDLKPLLCAIIAFSCKSFMILAYEFEMSSIFSGIRTMITCQIICNPLTVSINFLKNDPVTSFDKATPPHL